MANDVEKKLLPLSTSIASLLFSLANQLSEVQIISLLIAYVRFHSSSLNDTDDDFLFANYLER